MRHSFLNNLLVSILSVLTCLCLAYSIFGAGLYICTTPEATKTIGSSFSNWDRAVFPEEDMAAIAESVREFSVEGTSSEELYSEIENIIQKNYPTVFEAFKTGSLSDEAQKSEYASLFPFKRLHPYFHHRKNIYRSTLRSWHCRVGCSWFAARKKTHRERTYAFCHLGVPLYCGTYCVGGC